MTTEIWTLGELKRKLKVAKKVCVWVEWEPREGDYIEVPKQKFLKSIGADTPNDGAHGGRHDTTSVKAKLGDNNVIYVG